MLSEWLIIEAETNSLNDFMKEMIVLAGTDNIYTLKRLEAW